MLDARSAPFIASKYSASASDQTGGPAVSVTPDVAIAEGVAVDLSAELAQPDKVIARTALRATKLRVVDPNNDTR